jgi:hypothetical protein
MIYRDLQRLVPGYDRHESNLYGAFVWAIERGTPAGPYYKGNFWAQTYFDTRSVQTKIH